MKTFIETLKYVCLLLGSVIGAGFITGRELVSFFGYENYFFKVVVSGFCFFILFLITLKAGENSVSYYDLFGKISKRPKLLFYAFEFSVFITAGSTASALFEIFPVDVFFIKATFCFLVLFFCVKVCSFGMEYIKRINVYLTIAVIIITIILLKNNGSDYSNAFGEKENTLPVMSFLYAFTNTFINIPVILRGKSKSINGTVSIMLFSVIITIFIVMILNGISALKGNANLIDAPVFLAVKNIKIFRIVCLFSVITSLLTSLYPLSIYGKAVFTKTKGAPVFLGVYAFSFIGLKNIVGYVYPVLSVFGIIFIFLCVKYLVKRIGIKKGKNTNNIRINFEKR